MSKKMTWTLITAAATGITVYLLVKQKKSRKEKKYYEKRDKYLADVFSESKKYGGAEFVL